LDATRELPNGDFDAIAVTGSIETFDPRFVDALGPGGRLFVVVGSPPVMEARLVRRTGDTDWRSETLFETSLGPLVHGTLPPQFVF
jgi:protein-L-isoaspartate(D-aspartate) O-methyltransferase